MLSAAHAFTNQADSTSAGHDLGLQIMRDLKSVSPEVLIVFASSQYDYQPLLSALQETTRPRILIGCSSAGEFTSAAFGIQSACALALHAPEMQFTATIGHGLRANREETAKELVSGFQGLAPTAHPYRYALLLTDALAGYTDNLLEHLTILTSGTYQFFGGGAGDDGHFEQTHIFYGTEAYTDAVVALEILSEKPIGIGVAHGWVPASDNMRVTDSQGMLLQSMNATAAVEVMEEHAEVTGQTFDRTSPMPFFLHNVLGLQTTQGYKLRVPLGVDDEGGIYCASDVPTGSLLHIMCATAESSIDAAAQAAQHAMTQLMGARPKVALFFDCVATRLRMGKAFDSELAKIQSQLGGASYIGFNTYGQIARVHGQFSGFHNCTAVVAIFSE